MLLSIQQRYILDLLRKLRCLRREQVHLLAKHNLAPPGPDREISSRSVDAMMRQLRHCLSDVRLDDEVLRLAGVEPDARFLEAIDVMLELTECRPQDIMARQEAPVLLRFTLGGERLRLFAVADVGGLMPQLLSSVQRHKTERVIWISQSGQMPPQLGLPPKHFFAVRQEDGSHRFFGGDDS